MITAIKAGMGQIADRLGLLDRYVKRAQKKSPNTLTVFMYHSVIERKDPFFPGVLLSQFEQQMKYLREHWAPVSEAQIVDFYKNNAPLPDGAACVTFDDGYKDVITLALPVLKKYSIPAILFIPSEPVQNDDMLWTGEVAVMFKNTSATSLAFEIDGRAYHYVWRDDIEKSVVMRELKADLKQVSDRARHNALESVRTQLGQVDDHQRRDYLVNELDMKVLYESHVAIASHTVTHPILSQVSKEQAEYEVRECRDYLSAMGFPQRSFCYPNGQAEDYSDTTLKVLQDAGYEIAFTTIEGVNTAATNPLELRRIHVSNVAQAALKFRMARGLLASSVNG